METVTEAETPAKLETRTRLWLANSVRHLDAMQRVAETMPGLEVTPLPRENDADIEAAARQFGQVPYMWGKDEVPGPDFTDVDRELLSISYADTATKKMVTGGFVVRVTTSAASISEMPSLLDFSVGVDDSLWAEAA